MRMNVSAACKFHENKLLLEQEYTEGCGNILDNALFNPTKRSVQHWFDKWRTSAYGCRDGSDLKQVFCP